MMMRPCCWRHHTFSLQDTEKSIWNWSGTTPPPCHGLLSWGWTVPCGCWGEKLSTFFLSTGPTQDNVSNGGMMAWRLWWQPNAFWTNLKSTPQEGIHTSTINLVRSLFEWRSELLFCKMATQSNCFLIIIFIITELCWDQPLSQKLFTAPSGQYKNS